MFIEPVVLAEPLPFAFQFQATYASLLSFTWSMPEEPAVKVKPSELNAER